MMQLKMYTFTIILLEEKLAFLALITVFLPTHCGMAQVPLPVEKDWPPFVPTQQSFAVGP